MTAEEVLLEASGLVDFDEFRNGMNRQEAIHRRNGVSGVALAYLGIFPVARDSVGIA
ncbi:hypothetical protein [Streptomyces celluloflavus]|uniref:hypothetical protein n=1 Tax=Streptomyces celluloflavus TaxID=58344 RepID=UPI00369CABAB